MFDARKVDHCRLCGGPLSQTALSLGEQPISNRLSRTLAESQSAPAFPLEIALCEACGLPQLAHDLDPSAHFNDDYAYLSGTSVIWRRHCDDYASALVDRFQLSESDLVIEAGSNDGTLLKAFAKRGVKTLGIEPSDNVAEIARRNGVPTHAGFFNQETAEQIAEQYGRPKAFIGNNVLAHVPDTNGFLVAARDLIAEDGFLCFEFPHFVKILSHRYFDTIYHEHYCYLGVGPLAAWARRNGMTLFDARLQSTHGGSLRVFLKRGCGDGPGEFERLEKNWMGLEPWRRLDFWLRGWRARMREALAGQGRIASYAAASKATVLCSYLGLGGDDIAFCCDASALKQGRYIPGAGIPIVAPNAISAERPDAVLVFAWNIFDEIAATISDLIVQETVLIRPLPDIEMTTIPRASR